MQRFHTETSENGIWIAIFYEIRYNDCISKQ